MKCSKCGAANDDYAFFCDACGEPLPAGGFDNDALKEISAWRITPLGGEALILGDAGADDFDAVGAQIPTADGAASYIVYTGTSGYLSPLAVLDRASHGDTANLTPYEAFVLDLIKRPMAVADIEASSPLAHDELNVSLMTLVDRGLLRVASALRTSMPPTASPPRATMPPPARATMPPPAPAMPPATNLPPVIRATMPPPANQDVAVRPSMAPARRAVEVALPADHRARGRIRERASVPPPPQPEPPRAQPALTFNQRKAVELGASAKDDLAKGNVVSARMNLKLALSFDPQNKELGALFKQANESTEARKPAPRARSTVAERLLNQAADAETKNDIPRAVQLLEQALAEGEDPIVLNRLGVVLALKGRQIARGQELLERAVELDPKNATYSHNLGKVIVLLAERAESRQTKGATKAQGSFWSKLRGK
ncbi:MAG: hypothetical protein HY791_07815 [Deltaproteobacteria bacterium]|nr:hypothetical protein [Deltaproteobacteria bacterium]